jgi:hypothetical protein
MRINYKNTALGLIDDPNNFDFCFPDPDITPKYTKEELKSLFDKMISGAHHLNDLCGGNIQYVCSTFFNAFSKGAPKLKTLLHNEEIEDSGVLITGGLSDGYTHVHTIYYAVCSIRLDDGTFHYNVLYMDFSKHSKSDICALDAFVSVKAGDDDLLEMKSIIWNGYIEEGRDRTYWELFIILFCLFKKYCDIETKEVSPKNRRAKVGGNKYVNETNKHISILDCTWFTNLVVSGAFEVSGHLHWYWTGPNRSVKRLRYVHTYEKEGYTRKAKVLMKSNDA